MFLSRHFLFVIAFVLSLFRVEENAIEIVNVWLTLDLDSQRGEKRPMENWFVSNGKKKYKLDEKINKNEKQSKIERLTDHLEIFICIARCIL